MIMGNIKFLPLKGEKLSEGFNKISNKNIVLREEGGGLRCAKG